MIKKSLLDFYKETRIYTEQICKPLQIEDYVVQPIVDVSPPKWHLGHTTWFFEEFILSKYARGYKLFHEDFAYIFNSYYESVGKRVLRTDRGNLSRPSVQKIYEYRKYVDEHIQEFLTDKHPENLKDIIEIGIHHEKQHQELLLTDIKYILGHNPLFPTYKNCEEFSDTKSTNSLIKIEKGLYDIGYHGNSFCYDNELGKHKVYLESYEIQTELVTNSEYIEFIEEGGYSNSLLWHAEAWDWIHKINIKSPLYWHLIDNEWYRYGLDGLKVIKPNDPVTHVSYYEAFAFAEWKGMRLPTEFEWEASCQKINWGSCWEWTESAYLPYPGYKKAKGALGEYNGKFMVNQKVLRGKSIATSPHHTRPTYRNFFHPHLRWQFTGIRLATS